MSSVRDKVKLCSIDMNGVAVEKINGVPFYERYIEFDNTIKKHIIDRKYHNLFAQPVFNTTNGMIDWYVPANFQNAIKLSELKGTAEGDEYSKQKELTQELLIWQQSSLLTVISLSKAQRKQA